MQYSISNLNVFIILVTIGYSLNLYDELAPKYIKRGGYEVKKLLDKYNSPLQLISQLKGYFYKNPMLSLSLAITIFSFVGIPPLIGFFAKQMVLSAALDNGYVFLSLIAILTSVIGAVYYLSIIKEIFFFEGTLDTYLEIGSKRFNSPIHGYASNPINNISYRLDISSPLAITISIISLVMLLFIFMNKE